jgi:hypothetical protein
MKMAKCDICGQSASAYDLAQLRTCYQLPGVQDICPTCSRWANEQLRHLQDAVAPELRKRIAARVTKPAKKPSLLYRLFRSRPERIL